MGFNGAVMALRPSLKNAGYVVVLSDAAFLRYR